MSDFSARIGWRYASVRGDSASVAFLSAVSMAGLVLGVALLMLVLSVMNGFDRELRERILSLVPQAAVYHRLGIPDWRQWQARMVEHPQVEAAAPFIDVEGLASFRGQTAPLLLHGLDPSAELAVSRIGDFVAAETLTQLVEGPTVILGSGLAQRLAISPGQRLLIIVPSADNRRAPAVKAVTVLATVTTGTELDERMALASLALTRSLGQWGDNVQGLRLRLTDLFAARQVLSEIVPDLPWGFYGRDWTQTHGNLHHAIQMSRKLVALLLSLIVAIAAFNVVATLVMVVVDKQGDIAILRTLGASSAEVMRIFMVQGAVIGVVGTTLGLLLGSLLAWLAPAAVAALEQVLGIQFLSADVYPLSYLPSDWRALDALWIGGVALGLSLLATLYPAWRASRVQPAEALRYE